jgi:hypothetical protein
MTTVLGAVCALFPVSERSGLDLSPNADSVLGGGDGAAAHHLVSTNSSQVVDFIHYFSLPGKHAMVPVLNGINYLANLWAGFPQSYPQQDGKFVKLARNQ